MLRRPNETRCGQLLADEIRLLFDSAHYLLSAPLGRLHPGGPLAHYAEHGAAMGLDPHPLFQTRRYQALAGLSPETNALAHFLTAPADEAPSPHPLFDCDWYLARNPDVKAAGVNPLVHYLRHGWLEGRAPSPYFDGALYHVMHQDVAAARINPLVHYVTAGANERRKPHPLFDVDWYAHAMAGEPVAARDLFLHFVQHGDGEGRSPHPLFDPTHYAALCPFAARGGLPPLRHYLEVGGVAGLDPSPFFSTAHFLANRPDLAGSVLPPLVAYLCSDPEGQRHPHPLFDGAHQRAAAPIDRGYDDLLLFYRLKASNVGPAGIGVPAIPAPRPVPLRPRDYRLRRQRPGSGPLISVITPCWRSDPRYLELAVDSLRAQLWADWELILIDDGSPGRETGELLAYMAARDSRIRWRRLEQNGGISAATNVGLAMAEGKYVAMLDHDDVLTPDALAEMAAAHEAGADAAYSDQAYIDANGAFDRPFRKPDWSPTLLSGVMYVGHLLSVRTDLARDVGGFDSRFDRCQDFEFMLRVAERTSRIAHVPRTLYHWRRIPGSIAFAADAKGRLEPVQAAAVTAHLRRQGVPAEAAPHPTLAHRARLSPSPGFDPPPFDAFADGEGALPSDLAALAKRLSAAGARRLFLLVRPGETPPPAPWRTVADVTPCAAARVALAQSEADHALFVDARLRLTDKAWAARLGMHAVRAGVGFVTATLLRADGRVAAAGLLLDPVDGLRPVHEGEEAGADGEAGSLSCDREVSAPCAALTLASRAAVASAGGLSPDYGGLSCALAEAALRAAEAGLRSISVAVPAGTLPVGALDRLDVVDRALFLEFNRAAVAGGDPYRPGGRFRDGGAQ